MASSETMNLTKAEARMLRKMLVPGMISAGVGPVRRVQRQLVKKGLARWMSNANISAECKDDDLADWLLINVEGRRALEKAKG